MRFGAPAVEHPSESNPGELKTLTFDFTYWLILTDYLVRWGLLEL